MLGSVGGLCIMTPCGDSFSVAGGEENSGGGVWLGSAVMLFMGSAVSKNISINPSSNY